MARSKPEWVNEGRLTKRKPKVRGVSELREGVPAWNRVWAVGKREPEPKSRQYQKPPQYGRDATALEQQDAVQVGRYTLPRAPAPLALTTSPLPEPSRPP